MGAGEGWATHVQVCVQPQHEYYDRNMKIHESNSKYVHSPCVPKALNDQVDLESEGYEGSEATGGEGGARAPSEWRAVRGGREMTGECGIREVR